MMSRFPSKALLVLCGLLTVAACSTPRGAALESEVLRGQDDADANFQVVQVTRDSLPMIASWPPTGWDGAYVWLNNKAGSNSPLIQSGDRINLVIWDPQENSLIASREQRSVNLPGMPVSPEGTLFVPYVGEITVRGKTPSEVREEIQTALAPTVPSAQVQLTVDVGKLNSIDMVTGIAKPGSYPLTDRNTTILSMVASAGGVATNLRNPLVRLIRGGKTYEIRAEELFSQSLRNVVLQGGDKVLVEEDRRYFTALGAAGNESLVYFDREKVTAMEALSLIGGLVDSRANPKGILILRDYSGAAVQRAGGPKKSQVVFAIDLTSADGLFAARSFLVNPKDSFVVTESPVVAASSIMSLIGSVFGLRNTITN